MKNPAQWDTAELHRHLQHALELELWTLVLYLTALYSIKGLTKLKHHDYPEAAKLIFSIAIQEMLHIELVSNLSNALGYSPKFTVPTFDESKGMPFIHPLQHLVPADVKGYHAKPQALNKESLKLFCAIELPHPKETIVWEHKNRYGSIAEVYEAIRQSVTAHWDAWYVGNAKNTKQKNIFGEYHNQNGKHHGFSITIDSLSTALTAIEAIIDQGEGADAKRVPANFRPPSQKEGKEFDTSWYKGHLSHYQKFRILLHSHHQLPAVYEVKRTKGSAAANSKMRKAFRDFWHTLEMNFNSEGTEMQEDFWRQMAPLGKSLAAVWQSGTCPDFGGM
jgi:hypothetical protein